MATMPAEIALDAARELREEVPRLVQHVKGQCTELERRLGGAKLAALQRCAIARAQTLTPLYRANVMLRARDVQKHRLAFVQELQQLAKHPSRATSSHHAARHGEGEGDGGGSGLGHAAAASFPSLCRVLSAAYANMSVERDLTWFQQPLRPTQPAFAMFVAKASSPEYDLPRRLSAIRTRQDTVRQSGSADAATLTAALDDQLTALVEEALGLLLECMAVRKPTRPARSAHPGSRSHIGGTAPPRANLASGTDREDDDVQIIDHIVVDEETDVDEGEVNEVHVVPDDASTADQPEHASATKRQSFPVLRWPVLLSTEQFCMDMPEPVEAARERLAKRVAITKAGKLISPEVDMLLASTIGFYFSGLDVAAAAGGGGGEAAAAVAHAHSSPRVKKASADYGRDDDDEDDGGTLRLTEKERLVSAVTHTVVTHVNAAWAALRVTTPEPDSGVSPSAAAAATTLSSSPSSPSASGGAVVDVHASEPDAVEALLDVVRLRYSAELVAMVIATWSAVPLLVESDDARFFELGESREVRLWTLAPPSAGPSESAGWWWRSSVATTVLALPGMSNVFYCLSYCIGAALVQDLESWTAPQRAPHTKASHAARAGGGVAVVPAVDEEDDLPQPTCTGVHADEESDASGWSAAFAAAFLPPPSSHSPASTREHVGDSQLCHWWRVWLYLWDCVLTVAPPPSMTTATTTATRAAYIAPGRAKVWLERILSAWKTRALVDTVLIHDGDVPRDDNHAQSTDVTRNPDERQLNTEAVLQTGRTSVMTVWRDHLNR